MPSAIFCSSPSSFPSSCSPSLCSPSVLDFSLSSTSPWPGTIRSLSLCPFPLLILPSSETSFVAAPVGSHLMPRMRIASLPCPRSSTLTILTSLGNEACITSSRVSARLVKRSGLMSGQMEESTEFSHWVDSATGESAVLRSSSLAEVHTSSSQIPWILFSIQLCKAQITAPATSELNVMSIKHKIGTFNNVRRSLWVPFMTWIPKRDRSTTVATVPILSRKTRR